MPVVKSPDLKKKYPVPAWVKMILLLAVVFGLVVRSCIHRSEKRNIVISNVMITEYTTLSADVSFEITNKGGVPYKRQPIMIRIQTHTGEEIASRLTTIAIKPKTTQRYLKVLDKFERPLTEDEVPVAEVTLYKPGLFD